ncbi:MAG: alpha/beta hydrolase, partial [Acidobacteriales bacterium]|nr:alpha/beta hydrolase [Terriglobales bacterium]
NTVRLRQAVKAAGIVVETHLFAEGGHGFGMTGAQGKPAHDWPQLFARFARSQALFG